MHDKGHRQELTAISLMKRPNCISMLSQTISRTCKTITLYALVSQMRFISSPKVIEEAEKVVRVILETYTKPNKTFSELRDMAHDMAHEQSLDPLRRFSESCREELQRVAAL